MPVYPWNDSIWADLAAPRARSTHAWLFIGSTGLGKAETAMAYARHLVGGGEARAGELFDAGSHPDVHVLVREIDTEDSDILAHRYARRHIPERGKNTKPKTVISVDQVRNLIDALNTRAHSSARKVAVIHDAHYMNINAANALLKLLEEPPEDTVLVAVTDQFHRLPATVRSRCTIVTFSVPSRDEARRWLAEQVESDSLDTALDLAAGAPLEALQLIRNDSLQTRGTWLKGVEALCSGRMDVAKLAELGARIGARDALGWSQKVLMDLVRCRLDAPADRLFNSDLEQWLKKRAERLQLQDTFDLIDAIGKTRQDVDGPLDTQLLLEDLLVRLRCAVTGNP